MTLRLAVVGFPVGHSRSPVIHEAALEAVGLRATYDLLEVDEDGMRRVVSDIRNGGLDGVNVTMPYKGMAHDLCDRVSAAASRARSVNTIVGEDGQVRGYSTDITGLKYVWANHEM
ncbi:MAG: shikimate dehydrogenase, partial [Acidimicrobiia bacterium]|nr:shikimate dehydrogenase [Acidimicrobiia bacterium]